MRQGGRVIVIEMLLGEIGEPGPAPFMDLNMMVMLTGRERRLSEYRTLLKQGGFRLDKSSPIRSSLAVIEAGLAGKKNTRTPTLFFWRETPKPKFMWGDKKTHQTPT